MKNDQYFPLEVNLEKDERMAIVIEKHGFEGIGIYTALLMELRRHNNYRCGFTSIRIFARTYGVTFKKIESFIRNYGLFELTGEGDDLVISSPYLDRVMQKLEQKREKCSEAGKKGSASVGRASNGRFTVDDGTVKKSKEEKSKEEKSKENTATAVQKKQLLPVESWEKYVDDAFADKPWVEVLAMKSGMSKYFITHRQWLEEQFRQHVMLQASQERILSLNDAKTYMANFFRQGTVTQKRLEAELLAEQEISHQDSTYRYETVNPATGERTYFGKPIPPDAPPRPNNNAVWAENILKWV